MKKHYVVELYLSDAWYTARFQNMLDAFSFYNAFFKKSHSELKSISFYFVDDDGIKHNIQLEDVLDEVDTREDLPF